jgi:hypothetical protein
MPINVSGVDLMRQINDGLLKKAPTEYVERVRGEITEACEELLEIGARIRPLMAGKRQVGWVRGLHPAERKMLNRWLIRQDDIVSNVLSLTTSFSPEEVESFTSTEIRSLLNVIRQMTEYDVSLFPYLAAFVTTMSSENLWHGKGTQLSAFENRVISLPDGKQIRILTPPDHARLWASLCTYREQAKKRLDENFNALLIIRPWVGKNADPIGAELRALARTLATNAVEPWQNIIQVKSDVDVNDGWAHPGDSFEDLKREMDGFIQGDRHERLMEKFEQQMRDEAEARKQKLNAVVQLRGGPGITDEIVAILTDAQVREREKNLRKGRPVIQPVQREDREVVGIPADQIKKYR